jgi:hypothetical protein
MKVFVAGSRRFSEDFDEAIRILDMTGIEWSTGGKNPNADSDTPESTRMDNYRMFKIIDDADYVFVIAKDGYVGHSVSMELGYARAKGKKIISSEEIKELSVRVLVDKIMSIEEFVKYVVR